MEDIQDNNEIIAAFMGVEPAPEGMVNIYMDGEEMKLFGGEYHKSWQWLMPVVEKIITLRYPDYYYSRGLTEEDGKYDDCPYLRTFGMRDDEGNYMARFNASGLFHAPTLIQATYLAVVDFITYYNSISSPENVKK